MSAGLVKCTCGAEMKARNIGSHQLSAKHAAQIAEVRARTPGVRPGERRWSVVSKYNHDHTPTDRKHVESVLLARKLAVEEQQTKLHTDAVNAYEGGYFTTSELAEMLGVSRTTIFTWRKELIQ